MSRSTDPGHFFQSEAALASAKRKAAKAENNTAGNPIKLTSKILAVLSDPRDQEGRSIYVAESASIVRRLRVPGLEDEVKGEDVDLKQSYRGPTAPLTDLALSPLDGCTLFSSCWDKTIYSWNTSTRRPGRRYIGHMDFVKTILSCLLTASTAGSTPQEILLSGSADSTIIIWDIESGSRLVTVRETGRILDMAIDPASYAFPSALGSTGPSGFTIYTASSDPEIRRWRIEMANDPKNEINVQELDLPESLTHETSVNAVHFSPHLPMIPQRASDLPVGDEDEESLLLTASSDNTARSFASSSPAYTSSANGDGTDADLASAWTQDLKLQHPDFVRSIVMDPSSNLIVTACRDEEVRVFDASSGDLVHIWRGHFEEVTSLCLIRAATGRANNVVSVSIDGTVRCWSLDRAVMGAAKEREAESGEVAGPAKSSSDEEQKQGPELTEEEERELAELMDDDSE